jgi:hypothetical protein
MYNTPYRQKFQNKNVIKNDLNFGKSREPIIIKYINNYLDANFINRDLKIKDATIDFYDCKNNYECEVKSRRVKYNQYPTTILKMTKMRYFRKKIEEDSTCRCFASFEFSDCITLIEFTKENLYKYNEGFVKTYKNGICENELHVYIPIEELTIIHKKRENKIPYLSI